MIFRNWNSKIDYLVRLQNQNDGDKKNPEVSFQLLLLVDFNYK